MHSSQFKHFLYVSNQKLHADMASVTLIDIVFVRNLY